MVHLRLWGNGMKTLTLDLPDGVFAATRNDPDHFKREMRVAAAVTWYQEGRVSQEMAASIAGLDRTDFLLVLARSGHDSFVVDFDDLDKELARG
jgi:predicted HTH domain antitoxin